MIRKLRTKFIVLAMVAVFVLLAIVVAGMNLINYRAVVDEAEETLTFLAYNRGTFPGMQGPDGQFGPGADRGRKDYTLDNTEYPDAPEEGEIPEEGEVPEDFGRKGLPEWMSPETPYESRFFSVLLSADGNVQETDINRIASVSEEDAVAYAEKILAENRENGFLGDYLFRKTTDSEGVRITFLDCGRKLSSVRTFLWISLIVAAVGYALFFFVIFFYSKRIIQPVAESYEKQKRFITDAGHEIKTPLAIIKADADVLEMDHENNEWIEDIQKQTERLTVLTNDLVSLARMEEGTDTASFAEIALSELVQEESEAYDMLAQSEDKRIERRIEPALFVRGKEKELRRLVNILMDNALKYSPEKSGILLELKRTGKQVLLAVRNETKERIEKESLPLLFDRFYRTDASRNSETGGHGLGLSMAKAIAESHGGRISASSEDGMWLQIEAVLPGLG